jgi:pyruvate/2-oxoglutarate/acetoin dehydrogenase E1 component
MKYASELKRSMDYLAKDPSTIFLGQALHYAGTAMTDTLENVPSDRKIEMPVCEDMQAGITNGLALAGKIPVSIFPRWNFFLLATNQIINHLDKIPDISTYKTKAIIRTSVGAEWPWHPQHQHVGDYTEAFRLMCKNIEIIRLDAPDQIFPAYQRALERQDGRSTILVEWGDYYNEKSPIGSPWRTAK